MSHIVPVFPLLTLYKEIPASWAESDLSSNLYMKIYDWIISKLANLLKEVNMNKKSFSVSRAFFHQNLFL